MFYDQEIGQQHISPRGGRNQPADGHRSGWHEWEGAASNVFEIKEGRAPDPLTMQWGHYDTRPFVGFGPRADLSPLEIGRLYAMGRIDDRDIIYQVDPSGLQQETWSPYTGSYFEPTQEWGL